MNLKRVFVSLALVLLLSFVGLFVGNDVSASNIIWCNPANTGTADGTSKATGLRTLWVALSAASSGDTIVIANGDWTGYSGMSINNSGHLPPSGTSYANMTAIRAETDWGVRLPAILDLGTGGVNYVHIQGIIFHGFSNIYKWNHIKFIRCGFFGSKEAGNVSTFTVGGGYGGPGSSYVLVEECIGWGGGRYVFQDFFGNHNIYRRNVVRHDWYSCTDWYGQESSFRGYGSTYGLWQNNISIDSDRSQYYCSAQAEHADFWIGDQAGGNGNVLVGNISMKGHHQAYYLGGPDAGTGTISLSDNIALGPYTIGTQYLTGAITIGNIRATMTNMLFYRIAGTYQHFTNTNKANGSLSLKNSIAHTVGGAYFGTFNFVDHYNDAGGNWGTNGITYNPLSNGLLYPVRVETGSNLAKAGLSGTRVGPEILRKIGVSGKAMDEEGYDTVTTDSLWPFPNENTIKTLFQTTVNGVSGFYGFTTGTSLDGSPQTLTKYIWEYFGNQIPDNIYSKLNPPSIRLSQD